MKQLDADVMETICSSIDNTHDLLSLSLTSSCVWHMAIRATLRNHTIRLTSRKAIRSFRGFIINGKSTYAHHLRSLAIPNAAWMNIHEDHRPDEDNQLAMEILGCAVDLESLDFSLDPSYSAIPRVSSAFSSLEALRRLSVSEPLVTGDRSWVPHALHALRAPLVALCITTSKYHSVPNGLANYWDQNLSHLATSTTLTSLHLARIPVYDSSFLRLPRFASVRSLTVAEPLLCEPRLDAFLHLFPSLDGTLRLRVEYWKTLSISSNPQELATVQVANTHAQEVSQWTRLDTLDCEASTVHMLALQCPVRRLTIDYFDIHAIVRVQPRYLVINALRLVSYYDIFQPLPDTLEPISTTHVVLVVACGSPEYENAKINFETGSKRWLAVLQHTIQSLSAFPHATHARIVLHCPRAHFPPADDEVDDPARNSRDASRVVGGPPSGVVAACPALRCFVLTISGHDETIPDPVSQRWMGTRVWRAVDGRGVEPEGLAGSGIGSGTGGREDGSKEPERTFEVLGEYEAGRVIEDEDLGLPEEWDQEEV